MIGFLKVISAAILTVCLLAAPANAQLRPMVYSEVTVDAPVSDVWTDWTTADGLTSFFAKEANVDLRQGGAYQLYFAPDAPIGSRGNDAGEILGWQDERMLNVSWAMPPYMPEIRPHLTVLQLEFETLSAERTRLRVFHTGFGRGAEWEEGRDYFQATWPQVLSAYKKQAEGK